MKLINKIGVALSVSAIAFTGFAAPALASVEQSCKAVQQIYARKNNKGYWGNVDCKTAKNAVKNWTTYSNNGNTYDARTNQINIYRTDGNGNIMYHVNKKGEIKEKLKCVYNWKGKCK